MNNRYAYVDIARALGIMLVMMGHIELYYVPYCGSVHIPLFFILAGFLCDISKKSDKSYIEYVGRRVKRLLIPYFFYNLLLYLKYLLKVVAVGDISLVAILRPVIGFCYSAAYISKDVSSPNNIEGFTFGNAPLWFLTSMAVASVIFYFIVFYVLKHRFNIKRIVAAAVCLIIISRLLCELPIYLPWNIEMANLGAAFMLFGMCLRYYGVEKWIEKKIYVPVICIGIFTVLHRLNGWANLALLDYGKSIMIYYVLGALASLVIIFISIHLQRLGGAERLLSYIGQNTLVILAFHMTVISIMVSVLSFLSMEWLLNWQGFFAIRFIVGIVGCLIIDYIFKRVKLPKYLY